MHISNLGLLYTIDYVYRCIFYIFIAYKQQAASRHINHCPLPFKAQLLNLQQAFILFLFSI